MANDKKLDCVILGLLSHESLSGYEIKKRMDMGLKYLWGASFGSIYPTLEHLRNKGLATCIASPDSKRKKQIYTITPAGETYLRTWLQDPQDRDELRYETLLKLFFGNTLGPEETAGHIRDFEARIREELLQLQGLEQVLQAGAYEDRSHIYYLLTVQFGIQTYEGYLRWCNMAIRTLEDAAEAEGPSVQPVEI